MLAKRSGNSGRYLSVLNWLSENGLSSETCGRLWDLVIPSVAMSWATVCERIDGPRSLWIVSWSRTIPCLTHRLANQPLGQVFAFAAGQHPAHHVAAEDVEDHVEVEVRPLRRPQQLGDIPGPDLIGRGGHQLRLVVGRVPQLVSSLANFLPLVQDAVHRADRAEVLPLVQQRRVDLGRGLVGERLAVEHVEDFPAAPGRSVPAAAGAVAWRWLQAAWADAAGRALLGARPDCGMPRPCFTCGTKFLDGLHGTLPLLSGGGRGIPRISESFFWTSMIVSA